MRFLLLVVVAMPACALDDRGDRGDDGVTVTWPSDPPPSNGNCPTGEMCSSQTPNGLSFVGAQPIFLPFPNGLVTNINHQIAAGGTDVVDLQLAGKDFALPFQALPDYASILAVTGVTGANVSLRAVQPGTAYLRVVDSAGLLYDREDYAIGNLTTIVPVPVGEQVTAPGNGQNASSYVFAAGKRTIGIALLDGPGIGAHRLIDTSLSLSLAGATQPRWDELAIPSAVAGHYSVGVSVGGTGAPQLVDVEVVDKAEAITPIPVSGAVVCFAATVHGAFVAGLAWKYTVGGIDVQPYNDLGPNCVADIFANPTFTVTAQAGGQALTYTTTP